MAGPVPKPRKISDFKPTFDRVAQTSHYQIRFGGLSAELRRHLASKGVGPRYVGDEIGLLCNSAALPGSSLGTSEIKGNYMGLMEKHAHQRIFMDMQLEFYVDENYKSLKFLEHWIEFAAGGSRGNELQPGYHFRMRYPDAYKTDNVKIVKFERDYNRYIEYTFVGLFPKAVNDVKVSYEGSQLLKVMATFTYDRYISGETTSKAWWSGFDRNNAGNTNLNAYAPRRQSNGISVPNVDFFNRDIGQRIFTDAVGSNFVKAAQAANTLGGTFLGSGDSSTFEMF